MRAHDMELKKHGSTAQIHRVESHSSLPPSSRPSASAAPRMLPSSFLPELRVLALLLQLPHVLPRVFPLVVAVRHRRRELAKCTLAATNNAREAEAR